MVRFWCGLLTGPQAAPHFGGEFPLPLERGQGQGELGESTALFSLSSDGGGGEGRGEESRFYGISPLPNPPRSFLAGEGEDSHSPNRLIEWQWGQGEGCRRSNEHGFGQRCSNFSPSPRPSPLGRGRIVRRAFANPERLDSSQRGVRCSLSLRERARVRGNETPPTQTAGRILQAKLERLPAARAIPPNHFDRSQ